MWDSSNPLTFAIHRTQTAYRTKTLVCSNWCELLIALYQNFQHC